MSTNTAKYGRIELSQFSKLRFIYTSGSKKLQLWPGMKVFEIKSQLRDTPSMDPKYASFDYDSNLQSKNVKVPITGWVCSDDVLGYLSLYFKEKNMESKDTIYVLGITLVSSSQPVRPQQYFGTVKIKEILKSYTASSEIEHHRVCYPLDKTKIVTPRGLVPAQCQLPRKEVRLDLQSLQGIYDFTPINPPKESQ